MRTHLYFLGALLALSACTQPASNNAPQAPPAAPAIVCNTVAPNMARMVAVSDAVATASSVSDLRGGRIAPGVYDLASAERHGAATGWDGAHAVALEVSEDQTGAVVFNWASAASSAAPDTWTATFAETPTPTITYTCGRIGTVPAAFAAQGDGLQLRLQDGADGQLQLTFERRA